MESKNPKSSNKFRLRIMGRGGGGGLLCEESSRSRDGEFDTSCAESRLLDEAVVVVLTPVVKCVDQVVRFCLS